MTMNSDNYFVVATISIKRTRKPLTLITRWQNAGFTQQTTEVAPGQWRSNVVFQCTAQRKCSVDGLPHIQGFLDGKRELNMSCGQDALFKMLGGIVGITLTELTVSC